MNRPFVLPLVLFAIIVILAYLPLVSQFGYTFDDWYLMWSAKAYGVDAFHKIYSVDRPLRGYLMEAAYTVFGENPLWYNISAWFWRLLSGLMYWWILLKIWPRYRREALGTALLYTVYPGFLSQFNGIDYQSQIASLAIAMSSIALTVKACEDLQFVRKWIYIVLSIAFGWFYLGLVEYEIGFEFLRLGLIFVLFFRGMGSVWGKLLKVFRAWLPYVIITLGFGYWRFFVFVSERKATDIGFQLGRFLTDPSGALFLWGVQIVNDLVDIFFFAWFAPLQQVVGYIPWWGVILALVSMCLMLISMLRMDSSTDDGRARWEMLFLGFIAALVALLPAIMVNREVAFPYFSRYALTSASGVVLFISGVLLFTGMRWRLFGYSLLLMLALLLHQANSSRFAYETAVLRQFWWQVAWRIPQLEKSNTTLVAYWPVGAQQEDYFVWGPANLIYYPEKLNEKVMQPGVYAILPTEDAITKVLARERQQYDKRRNIVTYANYRNLLVLIQSHPSECVRVIDGSLPEISRRDDDRFRRMAPYSELEHILYDAPQSQPPLTVFGAEPEHTWCYYYEKATLARQKEDWGEIRRLGDAARSNKVFFTKNLVEWVPFIQAYAIIGDYKNVTRISTLFYGNHLDDDECNSLLHSDLKTVAQEMLKSLFCQQLP